MVQRERSVMDPRPSRVCTVVLLPLLILGADLFAASPVTAGLFECRNESGAPIYTDSPAQLDRCQPVASGGNSRLGLVGGAPPSSSHAPTATPSEPVASFPPPAVPPLMSPESGSTAIAPTEGLVSGSSEEPPCVPGINPLHPFSGPPCPASSHAAPPNTGPPPPGTPTTQP